MSTPIIFLIIQPKIFIKQTTAALEIGMVPLQFDGKETSTYDKLVPLLMVNRVNIDHKYQPLIMTNR